MAEAPRSNRPAPRTPAAVEAELRRRIRAELTQARSEADGQLEDGVLAGIIARAVASVLTWHLEAPEHTRNATASSRSWRPAPGPRSGGGRRFDEFEREDREPRDPRDFQRGPRPFERGPRDFPGRPPRPPFPPRPQDPRGRRDFDQGPPDYGDAGPREFDRGPRRGPAPRGGGFGFKRGGFGPKRPPRSR
jgi:hypothetical protein